VPIYALDDRTPNIHPDALVMDEATIIGAVTIGAHASIWPGVVLRGDYGAIVIGEGTSVQDGSVIHATMKCDTIVGSRVVVGHLAHLEGCTIEDGALIGVGSAVLPEAVVGAGATVGAGAVVTNGMVVPPRALAVGVPAQIKLERSSAEYIQLGAQSYIRNAARYKQGLRRIG
jgi:carbonic anhydrase/acetyltransferase-like protein (isoleucine patch superfamily)